MPLDGAMPPDEEALLTSIRQGSVPQNLLFAVIGRWFAAGIAEAEACDRLGAAFDAAPMQGPAWQAERAKAIRLAQVIGNARVAEHKAEEEARATQEKRAIKEAGAEERGKVERAILNWIGAADLWHTPDGEGWMTLAGWHYPLGSPTAKQALTAALYKMTKKAAAKTTVEKALANASAVARYERPERTVYLRHAFAEGAYWIDLANKKGEAVRIDAQGWGVVPAAEVPVKFYRPPTMRSLPTPLREEADAFLLEDLLHLRDATALRLVLTWQSYALLPGRSYPILTITGPAGSAKSSTARTVRGVIDPCTAPLRGVPKRDDLPALALNNAIVALDNLSSIRAELADDLCRLSTGGGQGGRKLFTNDDERVFAATRPVIINGMGDLATRGDLADRTLGLLATKIEDFERRTEEELEEGLAYAHPRILAGLLDMVVRGLARKEGVRRTRPRLPRMADFALWGRAVAPALDWSEEDFARAYDLNRRAAFAAVVADDAVAKAVLDLMGADRRIWEGTTGELWDHLMINLAPHLPKGFPETSAALGRALDRLEPALASKGIRFLREGHGMRGAKIRLERER